MKCVSRLERLVGAVPAGRVGVNALPALLIFLEGFSCLGSAYLPVLYNRIKMYVKCLTFFFFNKDISVVFF